MLILKRDGRSVEFDSKKIYNAIEKASKATNENLEPIDIDYVTHKVVSQLKDPCTVEQVQDIVEKTLIKYDFENTAKAYILYRAQRAKLRNVKSELMEIFDEIIGTDAIDSDLKRENANVDGNTAMGTMLKFGSESAKYYTDKYVLPEKMAKAHQDGDIHIHDKDFYIIGTETCCQLDPLKLFKNGFNTGHGFLREPKSIQSYASLACIALQANQNEQHGGQSIPNFDYAMAPGVTKSFKKNFKAALVEALMMEDFTNEQAVELLKDIEMPTLTTYKDWHKNIELDIDKKILAKCSKVAGEVAFKKTDKDTYQAMEGFVHNLNTMHSRAGRVA